MEKTVKNVVDIFYAAPIQDGAVAITSHTMGESAQAATTTISGQLIGTGALQLMNTS
jgi:hypothetical protein